MYSWLSRALIAALVALPAAAADDHGAAQDARLEFDLPQQFDPDMADQAGRERARCTAGLAARSSLRWSRCRLPHSRRRPAITATAHRRRPMKSPAGISMRGRTASACRRAAARWR